MQIHKATADFLGIKMKQGMYEAKAGQTINMHEHTQILMKFQIDIKEQHEKQINYYRELLNKEPKEATKPILDSQI